MDDYNFEFDLQEFATQQVTVKGTNGTFSIQDKWYLDNLKKLAPQDSDTGKVSLLNEHIQFTGDLNGFVTVGGGMDDTINVELKLSNALQQNLDDINDQLNNLDETVSDKVREQLDDLDVDGQVEKRVKEAVDNLDLSDEVSGEVEKQLKDYDFTTPIESAIEDQSLKSACFGIHYDTVGGNVVFMNGYGESMFVLSSTGYEVVTLTSGASDNSGAGGGNP